jgi:hypothetical protein
LSMVETEPTENIRDFGETANWDFCGSGQRRFDLRCNNKRPPSHSGWTIRRRELTRSSSSMYMDQRTFESFLAQLLGRRSEIGVSSLAGSEDLVGLAAASLLQKRVRRNTADAKSRVERTETAITVARDRSAAVARRHSVLVVENLLLKKKLMDVSSGVGAMSTSEKVCASVEKDGLCR